MEGPAFNISPDEKRGLKGSIADIVQSYRAGETHIEIMCVPGRRAHHRFRAIT